MGPVVEFKVGVLLGCEGSQNFATQKLPCGDIDFNMFIKKEKSEGN